MQVQLSMYPELSVNTRFNRFNSETAMLLAALLVVVWLRLALPVINFGQPMSHVMVGMDSMASMAHAMDDPAGLADSQTPTDQRCRDTMPGCDTYLVGLCPFAPVFVVTSCTIHVSPVLAQAAPPFTSADDLSPPSGVPKIPPRP